MYYRDRQAFDDLKREYRADRVNDHIVSTRRAMVEIADNLSRYIEACNEQLRVIVDTRFEQYVYFQRRSNYYTNRIYYAVGVTNVPDVPNGQAYQWATEETVKAFTGREKRQAKQYAEQLAKEYRCEVVSSGH